MKLNGYDVNEIIEQGFFSYMSKANPNILPGTLPWINKKTDFEQGAKCIVYFLQHAIKEGQKEGTVAGDISTVKQPKGIVVPKDMK